MFILFNSIFDKKIKKLHYYHYNAINFLKETNKKYDIIIDDIFSDKGKVFYNYKLAFNKLKKDGVLLINLHDINDYHKYENKLKKLFDQVFYYELNEICVVCIK